MHSRRTWATSVHWGFSGRINSGLPSRGASVVLYVKRRVTPRGCSRDFDEILRLLTGLPLHIVSRDGAGGSSRLAWARYATWRRSLSLGCARSWKTRGWSPPFSPIRELSGDYLKKHGEALHHTAFRVPDTGPEIDSHEPTLKRWHSNWESRGFTRPEPKRRLS